MQATNMSCLKILSSACACILSLLAEQIWSYSKPPGVVTMNSSFEGIDRMGIMPTCVAANLMQGEPQSGFTQRPA